MVTPADVRLILDTDLSDTELGACITGATELVNEAVKGVSAPLRRELIRWLAAHLIASTREQQIAEAGAGPASVKFQGQTGLGLDSTQYGQQAKALDITGALAALDLPGRRQAFLFAVESFV